MKVVIPGGSGQVGAILARAFSEDKHEVVILGRSGSSFSKAPSRHCQWDGTTLGPWVQEIDGADVVINLAGRNVSCRYNATNRQEIMESRVQSTQAIGEAIRQSARPPCVWLQSSTATIYAHRYDAPNDEITGILGGNEPGVPDTWRFSIAVAQAWEQAATAIETPNTRKVLLRSAMTMSPDRGGVFDVLLGLVRKGLGGTNGDGKQYVSWIHEYDFVRAIKWLIEHEMEGPVNLSSPEPLPNAEFMATLRRAWGAKIGLPATKWMLELGAIFLQTETELILKSRRVVPGRLLEAGFEFKYPHWKEASTDLCQRWKAARSA